MTDAAARSHGDPTDEEIAAALAAVHLLVQQRGRTTGTTSRWMRAGRVEAVTPLPVPARWAMAERPR